MDEKKKCPFCDELKKLKESDAYYRKSELATEKYTVALVREAYWEKNFTGSLKCCGHELNFCPTCGKALPDVNNNSSDTAKDIKEKKRIEN